MKYLLIISIILSAGTGYAQTFSCSGFIINDTNNIILAKNLDWELGNGIILFNPRNKIKKSIYSKNGGNKWFSKYSSITFNHFGLNQPLGGMNEKGLVIEELSTWPTEYPHNDLDFTEFEWIQYQLDNYKTTEEVALNIDNTSIKMFYFRLHYLITDKYGDKTIVEFINGKPVVYRGSSLDAPVLTNNNYHELNKYLSMISESDYKKLNINTSQDRFVKIVLLLKEQKNSNSPADYLSAMNILDSVKATDTQWSVIYNVLDRTIHYKTKFDNHIKEISFPNDYAKGNNFQYISLGPESREQFESFQPTDNINYLEKLKKDIMKHYGEKGAGLVKLINLYLE